MRSNRSIGVAAAIGLLIGALTFWTPATPGQAPALRPGVIWEYKLWYFGPNSGDHTEMLNKLGQDGWELAEVDNGPQESTYVFKRPKLK
jgi:hypothetical protein